MAEQKKTQKHKNYIQQSQVLRHKYSSVEFATTAQINVENITRICHR